ncbi:MAG TPA: hypothetical protein VN843_35250 [Anaerolineales bacterium]|nr:hypothetical protein [Anaerolineales bacterium]
MRLAITILLLLSCVTSHARQQENRFYAAGLNDQEVETFFLSFREAVSARDKKKVASLISYPIKLKVAGGRTRTIRSRVDFVKAYDRIFDEEFRQLIVKTETKDLWARWTGVATPRGEIWFSGIGTKNSPDKYTIKIIAINGPIR